MRVLLKYLTVLSVAFLLQTVRSTSDPHTPKQSTNLLANITLNCEDICSFEQCIYPVPEEVHTHLWSKDCEQEWLTQDGNFLVDGSPSTLNRSLPHLVLAVTPGSLTVLYCMNELQYKMTCHGSQYQFQVLYKAVNNTKEGIKTSDQSINTTTIVIILVAVGAMAFLVVWLVIWVYRKTFCSVKSCSEVQEDEDVKKISICRKWEITSNKSRLCRSQTGKAQTDYFY
ncbi:hypothetical protein MHYP_G00310110 [Metynnis hypsauchen]